MATHTTRAHRALNRSIAAFGGLTIGVSTSALALSLGAPQPQSHLAEPLVLKLPITDATGDLNRYRLRLLPASAYTTLGYPPPEHGLQDFTVSINGAGSRRWVLIRSRLPIREPILSLLLEVRKPGSTLIRSIDLLLDPPPTVEPAPIVASADVPAANAPRSPVAGSATRPEPGLPANSRIAGYYGPVRPGESLSRISQRARPRPDIPIDRMAAALYRLNPGAFDGSPHRLRQGVTLAVPDLATIERMSASLAWYKKTPAGVEFQRSAGAGPAPRQDADPARGAAMISPPTRVYLQGQFLALELTFSSYQPLTLASTGPAPASPAFQMDWRLDSLGDKAVQTAGLAQADEQAHTATDLGWEPELAAPPTRASTTGAPTAREAAAAQAEKPAEPSREVLWLRWLTVIGLLGIGGVLTAWLSRQRQLMTPPRAGLTPIPPYRDSGSPQASPDAGDAAPPVRRQPPGRDRSRPAGASPRRRAAGQSAPLSGRDPAVPAAETEPMTNDPAVGTVELQPEGIEDDDPRVGSLHLRLTALLADEPDTATRRQANVALASLDAGDIDRAELLVATLESLQQDVQAGSTEQTDKVVPIQRRQHAKG